MYAVTGNLISVDLTNGKTRMEKIPEQIYRNLLGGYGLGVALLLKRMDPSCNPLGPENILGMAAGYLTGTGAYIASRYMVFGKSPSTGGWGDSNCGGYFGKKMKQAGVDVILFRGVSAEPVYLYVEEGKHRILDASPLWGKDCYETEDLLKSRHGEDCEVACIGPAGERLSAIAGISTDKGRFAARSALGAVMGSKKLKAVVVKGDRQIELADPDRMKKLRKKYLPVLKKDLGEGLSTYGTPVFYDGSFLSGDIPVKNWSSSCEELKDHPIKTETQLNYQKKRYACSGCPVGCGGHVRVDEGEFRTPHPVHKAEYETMGMMGPNLMNNDIEAVIRINDLCNRYGMDTIGCGGLCGYAIECYERGLIGREQTGGLELKWGDSSTIVHLVELIGKGEGIGAVLSGGFEKAISTFGEKTRPYAIAVRNEALPAHDPRWNAGLALTYYFDPTPARHTQGSTTFPLAEYNMPEIPPHEASGRGKHHHYNVNMTHVLNSAGLCLFGYILIDYRSLPEYLNAADGKDWSMEELEKMGFRITVLRQIFNVKLGITPEKYDFPERALGNPPLETGENRGVRVDLGTMLKEYLEAAGLDPETGLPPKSVLEELGIAEYL
ncbi:MAG: aldehyde ferredoxin oxidoreductase, partial [Spirochaetes bacterium]